MDFEDRISQLAQEALELCNNPRSHVKFYGNVRASVEQIVDEQDTLDCTTIGEVMNYRNNLIAEVKGYIDSITPL